MAAGPSLVEFLAARLDEDEARARRVQGALDGGWNYFDEVPTELIDPARVLREVAAGRAILALHRIEVTFAESQDDDYRPVKIPEVQCFVCGWASDVEGSACETLHLLAAIYGDHPGYQQEWAIPASSR